LSLPTERIPDQKISTPVAETKLDEKKLAALTQPKETKISEAKPAPETKPVDLSKADEKLSSLLDGNKK
jgi:hypothetical protein